MLIAFSVYHASALPPAEAPKPTGSAEFKGCHASWNECELVIGNSHFERKCRIDNGLCTATSFRDLGAKVEWLAKPANRPAPYPAGAIPVKSRGMLGSARSGRLHLPSRQRMSSARRMSIRW